MLQGTPHCRSEPSLCTEQIVCWTVPRGARQQPKGSPCSVILEGPSVQEGCREYWKGPTKVPNTHTLCREAEGAGLDNSGKGETTEVFNTCLQLYEGQFFGHHHQTPLGSVRQHNKENNHTKQFQRLKLESWKTIFASSTGMNTLSNRLRDSVLQQVHPDKAMTDLFLCCNSPLPSSWTLDYWRTRTNYPLKGLEDGIFIIAQNNRVKNYPSIYSQSTILLIRYCKCWLVFFFLYFY